MNVGIYEIDQFFFAQPAGLDPRSWPHSRFEVFVDVPEEVFARWEAAKNAHFAVVDEIKALYDAEMRKLAAAEEDPAPYCPHVPDGNACDICDKEDA